jgi:hypothetical protein
MRTGNTTVAAREELALLYKSLKEAKNTIRKAAEADSFYGIQPPPYITEWLREYEEMGQ